MPPPGTPILVVSDPPDWRTLVALVAEQRLAPIRAAKLPGAPVAKFALVRESLFATDGWRALASARGWVLATRPVRQGMADPARADGFAEW